MKTLSALLFLLAAASTQAAQSPIVGSWYATHLGDADSTVVLTFLPNGEYFLADDGSIASDPSGQPGMERGHYSWNELTGAFSSTTEVNTDGEWGLSHGQPASILIGGDSLSAEGDTLFRLPQVPSSIVGSWYLTNAGQANSTVVVSFLSDGQFFLAEDGDSTLDPSGQDGMERGTYSWDSVSGSFQVVTLPVDTNGGWGLSGAQDVHMSVLPGGSLRVTDSVEGTEDLIRVTAVPEPQVWVALLLGVVAVGAVTRRRA